MRQAAPEENHTARARSLWVNAQHPAWVTPGLRNSPDETKYLLPSWGADKRSHDISCEAWRRLPVLKLNSLCQQTKPSLNSEAVCELLLGT